MKRSVRTTVIILAIVVMLAAVAGFTANAALGRDIPMPKSASAINTSNGISVTWEKSSGAEGYYIYKHKLHNLHNKKVAQVKSEDKPICIDKDVEYGEEYVYTVKAYKGSFKGKPCKRLKIVALEEPTIKEVTSGNNSIDIVWKKSPGAEGYRVYKTVGNKILLLSDILGEDSCGFSDRKIKEGEKYNYTVVAYKGDSVSAHTYKESHVYLKMPEITDVYSGNKCMVVKWKPTGSAISYSIFRKENAQKEWTKIAAVKGNVSSFQDKNIKDGSKYLYTVMAKKDALYSGYNHEGVGAIYIPIPKNTEIYSNENGIFLKWDSVVGAENYKVFRKEKNAPKWELATDTKKTEYADIYVEDGKTYSYLVKAVTASGESSGFIPNWASFTYFSAPENFAAVNTKDGVELDWDKKPEAQGYEVYRKNPKTHQWEKVRTIKSNSITSFVDYEVKKNKTYSYYIKAYKGKCMGSPSEVVEAKFISTPSITARLTPKGIKLTWFKTEECKGYEIYRRVEGQKDWKEVIFAENDVFSHIDNKAATGKFNYYRLRMKMNHGKYAEAPIVKIFGVDPKKPMVALTYDDGPNPGPSTRILNTLEKYNSRATFFIVGERISWNKEILKRQVDMGCEIGNHTYHHKSFSSSTVEQMQQELRGTNDEVRKLTGYLPKVARAPGGAIPDSKKNYVGMPLIQWSVDTLDWKYRNADSVINEVKSSVGDGSIVLMHDLYDSTAAASEVLIPWLVKEGYQLVTISEMMDAKGIEMENGEVYYNGNK